MEYNNLQLFEDRPIRTAWDEEKEEWYFSVVDVISALTNQPNQRGASNYWAKLKQRLKQEGSELLTKCQQLKMTASDGKMRLTDVASTEQLLRIIHSINDQYRSFVEELKSKDILGFKLLDNKNSFCLQLHWDLKIQRNVRKNALDGLVSLT